MAPATPASSTSLIEQPSALPIAFTASSGIGSPQATRFTAAGLPLSRVGESSAISAIAVTSPITWAPSRALSIVPAMPFCGSARPRARGRRSPRPCSAALADRPPSGLSTASASQSAPSASSGGGAALASRRVDAAVGDRHHHRDQGDAVADAVVDAGDQGTAAFVALDQARTSRAAAPRRAASSPACRRAPAAPRARSAPRPLQLPADDVAADVEGRVVASARRSRRG